MDFLRSIIADARSSNYFSESGNRRISASSNRPVELNDSVSGSEAKSPDLQNTVNHVASSMPVHEYILGRNGADISVSEEVNPVRQDNSSEVSEEAGNNMEIGEIRTTQPDEEKSQKTILVPAGIGHHLEISDGKQLIKEALITENHSAPDIKNQITSIDGPEKTSADEKENISDKAEYIKPISVADRQTDNLMDEVSLGESSLYKNENEIKSNQTEDNRETSKPLQGIPKKTEILNLTDDTLRYDKKTYHVSSGIKRPEEKENNSSQGYDTGTFKKSGPVIVKRGFQNNPQKNGMYHNNTEAVNNNKSQMTVQKQTTSAVNTAKEVPNTDSYESHSNNRKTLPVTSPKIFRTESTYKAVEDRQSRPSHSFSENMSEKPSVQIGQIDVIIEMPAKPASKPAPALSTDLASRYYLRRL